MKILKNLIYSTFLLGVWWIVVYATNIAIFNSWDTLSVTRINELVNKINSLEISSGGVPSWAIMSFNLTNCPSWWSEYTLAYWRFIRWIDKSWTNIDPDWERALEGIQWDAIRNITWEMWFMSRLNDWSEKWAFSREGSSGAYNFFNHDSWVNVGTATFFNASKVVPTADENRPKNVALLYCQKD